MYLHKEILMKSNSKKAVLPKSSHFFREYIEKNTKRNEKLLSEKDIPIHMKGSRITVRKAINESEKMDYNWAVYKIYGRGSFCFKKLVYAELNDI